MSIYLIAGGRGHMWDCLSASDIVDDFGGTLAHWTSLYGRADQAGNYGTRTAAGGLPRLHATASANQALSGYRDETTILRSINEIDVAAWKVLGKSVGRDMVSRP